jgi:hypothetical protein
MIGKFGGIRQVKENEALEFPETLIVFEWQANDPHMIGEMLDRMQL